MDRIFCNFLRLLASVRVLQPLLVLGQDVDGIVTDERSGGEDIDEIPNSMEFLSLALFSAVLIFGRRIGRVKVGVVRVLVARLSKLLLLPSGARGFFALVVLGP